jgi:hypothetical protein
MMVRRNLLDAGWKLRDIDDMDFISWMNTMAYSARPKDAFIDDFLH